MVGTWPRAAAAWMVLRPISPCPRFASTPPVTWSHLTASSLPFAAAINAASALKSRNPCRCIHLRNRTEPEPAASSTTPAVISGSFKQRAGLLYPISRHFSTAESTSSDTAARCNPGDSACPPTAIAILLPSFLVACHQDLGTNNTSPACWKHSVIPLLVRSGLCVRQVKACCVLSVALSLSAVRRAWLISGLSGEASSHRLVPDNSNSQASSWECKGRPCPA